MLKLTKKADYGLIALRHLASVPGATASTKDMAEADYLPVTLLVKVLEPRRGPASFSRWRERTAVTS